MPEGPFLVVGLARSGAAAARLLAGRGEEVRGCDAAAPEGAADLAADGVRVSLRSDGVELLDGVRTVVKSPGVPDDAPAVAAARARGIAVMGELEVAWRALPNRFIGVTGTNGKTTTVELIGHLYRTAAMPVAVAGNVGAPLSSLVGEASDEATVVCECSSFQLDDADRFAPECAVLLNLAPDHLDRHAGLDAYLAAKLRIFANQANEDVAVVNGDEPALLGRDLGGCARPVSFCGARSDPGPADGCAMRYSGGTVFWLDEPLFEAEELRLLGRHNVENAMAAAAAALSMGVEADAVAEGLRSFSGVRHRLERVAEIDGVVYVDDSKATNVAAARAAIEAFDRPVHAILGGRGKGESFAGLEEAVIGRCRACYLIGDAADQIAGDLAEAARVGVPLRRCADLEHAVRAAAVETAPGEVVLLSPACASFDAYRDFEERGEHFRAIVDSLS
jgi:UDP-N-acetylmuramoylalanine--D-glutamate ligase